DRKCRIQDDEIHLDNKVNFENFKVFIIPGSRTISLVSLVKIEEFFDRGGKVMATTRLPDTAAEFGQDAAVQKIIAAMFGDRKDTLAGFTCQKNSQGGRAFFARKPTAKILKTILDEALP